MTGDGTAFVRRITQSRYSSGGRAMTHDVIWLRFEKPSLVRMCCTWFWAVRSERNRAEATSRLDLPAATSPATSSSRAVSVDAAAG